ncbi:MAG: type II and III secretion system protein [Bdellovibrionales bacterium]|nr:type II and III secretion system protein [Bdellovibrionales bacterium]
MKNFNIVLLLHLFLSFPAFGKNIHYIEPGEIIKITIPTSSNVHISTKRFLMIEDLYSHLKIVGKREGKTVINIGSHIHILYVVDSLVKKAIEDVEKIINNMIGVELIVNNGVPVITGKLHRLKDWIDVRKAFGGSLFKFEAKIDDDLKPKIIKYMNNELASLPSLENFRTSPYPQVTYFNIPEKLKSSLQKYYKSWGIEDVLFIENPDINYQSTIEIALEFYEVSITASKSYGINWANTMGYQLFPESTVTGDLQSQLQLLVSKGDAKLVQRSTLKTANTHSVKFVAGGEIAIPQYSYKSKSVTWKTYGLQLEFTPKIIKSKIQTKIKAEVSDIHESQTVNGIPGIKTNKYESLLSLEPNSPVIISGLIKKRRQKTTEGILGLSDIPLFGELFKSNQFVNNQSELVVVLTVKQVDDL